MAFEDIITKKDAVLKFMVAIVSNIPRDSIPTEFDKQEKMANDIANFAEALNFRYHEYVKFMDDCK